MTKARDQAVARIAGSILQVETLATRNSDSLDFRDIHVANLKAALEAAFEAGRASVLPKAKRSLKGKPEFVKSGRPYITEAENAFAQTEHAGNFG